MGDGGNRTNIACHFGEARRDIAISVHSLIWIRRLIIHLEILMNKALALYKNSSQMNPVPCHRLQMAESVRCGMQSWWSAVYHLQVKWSRWEFGASWVACHAFYSFCQLASPLEAILCILWTERPRLGANFRVACWCLGRADAYSPELRGSADPLCPRLPATMVLPEGPANAACCRQSSTVELMPELKLKDRECDQGGMGAN